MAEAPLADRMVERRFALPPARPQSAGRMAEPPFVVPSMAAPYIARAWAMASRPVLRLVLRPGSGLDLLLALLLFATLLPPSTILPATRLVIAAAEHTKAGSA